MCLCDFIYIYVYIWIYNFKDVCIIIILSYSKYPIVRHWLGIQYNVTVIILRIIGNHIQIAIAFYTCMHIVIRYLGTRSMDIKSKSIFM